jgi:hypothetical protein
MTPAVFVSSIIDPGLRVLQTLGGPDPSNSARRLLLTIALQESGQSLTARYQNHPATSPGPARGWWQFELIGVRGVMTHNSTKVLAHKACIELSVFFQEEAIHRALEGHDTLACIFARLLLLSHPATLPDDETTAWNYYFSCWRPGKPHQSTWASNWALASNTI